MFINNNDKTITIRQLDPSVDCPVMGTHLKQSLLLQKAILEELAAKGKDGYVIEKSENQVSHYMINHYIMGIFKKKVVSHNDEAIEIEELVAQVTVYIPKVDEVFDSQIECFDEFNLNPLELMMIKGLEVHESARGNKYAKILVQIAHSIAKDHGRRYVITDIAFANIESLCTFIHSGYIGLKFVHPVGDVELGIVFIDLEWRNIVAEAHTADDYYEVSINDYHKVKQCADAGYHPTAMYKSKGSDEWVYHCQKVPGIENIFAANDPYVNMEEQAA
ncbi:MAG TPA: hypothetical protein DCL21_02835 [Alphaproteobacteria bacterium]|nr:hypothetical protein [Alphaproteobacteria bacterium]